MEIETPKSRLRSIRNKSLAWCAIVAVGVTLLAYMSIGRTPASAKQTALSANLTALPQSGGLTPTPALSPIASSPITRLERPGKRPLFTPSQAIRQMRLTQFRVLNGVQCQDCSQLGGERPWNEHQPIPWEIFAQGEWIGPARALQVPQYHIRAFDQLELTFRLTRDEIGRAYQFNIGDRLKVESLADPDLTREVEVQPDGNITLQLLGQVRASRRSVAELQAAIDLAYQEFYPKPEITITPIKMDTRLSDLLATVDSRQGAGGQTQAVTVAPDGTIQPPAIGSVPAQGLTLDELKIEINERYAKLVAGLEVQPRLVQIAPRFVFVLGEVNRPNRYQLQGPTTVMQAIALAGGWNNGGNLRDVVVFRRGDNWELMATKLDIRGALLGKRPCPADEVFVRDSDIVLVPKSALLLFNDFVQLVFTRGIYGVLPNQGISLNFSKNSTL